MQVAQLAAAFPDLEDGIQIFNRDQIPQNRLSVIVFVKNRSGHYQDRCPDTL